MSQADYVKTKGQQCPACRSGSLEFSDRENHVGWFQESASCSCGFEFKRVFTLTGYEVDEGGKGEGLDVVSFNRQHPGCIHFESLRVAKNHQSKKGGELWSFCKDLRFRPGRVDGARGYAVTR